MTLTLLSVEDGYNVYEDEDGDEVMMTPGPVARKVVHWEDFDLEGAWANALTRHRWTHSYYSRPDRDAFLASVRQAVTDPDAVEVEWCASCEAVVREEDTESTNDGAVCSPCFQDNYRTCEDCDETVHYDQFSYTLHDRSVCSSCLDNYLYCEDCDGYYDSDYREDHRHGGCDCVPPTTTVAFHNGDAVLAENQRVTVSLPAGVISEEGMYSISRLVRYSDHAAGLEYDERMKWWNLSYEVMNMDTRWQTKEGNFTKRLSKLAHKSQGLKFPPELLTQVGNIARDNSQGTEIQVELTRDLNLPAEAFYHEDSCWWQSYAESRCSLKSNGGIGMRTFGDYDRVQGRAWVMPLKLDGDENLHPTFDSLTADAFMVFNGYGDLSGYIPARVVAGMVGMTYRKITFDCEPMYVNGNSGYLVASEEVANDYAARGRLVLCEDSHSALYHNELSARVAAEYAASLIPA